MKKIILLLLMLLVVAFKASAEDKSVDFEIKTGLEIIGAKEVPRVIFFLPPLELKMEKRKVKNSYFLDKTLIEEDFKGLINEEVKDVSNVR